MGGSLLGFLDECAHTFQFFAPDEAQCLPGFVAAHGGKYSFELAKAFAEEKSGGVRVSYENEISVAENGGWRCFRAFFWL